KDAFSRVTISVEAVCFSRNRVYTYHRYFNRGGDGKFQPEKQNQPKNAAFHVTPIRTVKASVTRPAYQQTNCANPRWLGSGTLSCQPEGCILCQADRSGWMDQDYGVPGYSAYWIYTTCYAYNAQGQRYYCNCAKYLPRVNTDQVCINT